MPGPTHTHAPPAILPSHKVPNGPHNTTFPTQQMASVPPLVLCIPLGTWINSSAPTLLQLGDTLLAPRLAWLIGQCCTVCHFKHQGQHLNTGKFHTQTLDNIPPHSLTPGLAVSTQIQPAVEPQRTRPYTGELMNVCTSSNEMSWIGKGGKGQEQPGKAPCCHTPGGPSHHQP